MAVADASYNTVKVSMSFGFKEVNGLATPPGKVLSTGNPSITINGSLLADSEDPPLILIVALSPGAPLLETTETPAILPKIRSCGEVKTPLLKSLPEIAATAPVASFF